LNEKDLKPGKHLFGIFVAVKKEYRLIGPLFYFDMTHWLRSQGFERFYGRYTNKSSKRGALVEGG
jgi:hypothetical protein